MPKKVKVVKAKTNDKEIAEMFNQMLGTGESVNMEICYPRYKKIKELIEKTRQVLDHMYKSSLLKTYDEFANASYEIKVFSDKLQSIIERDFKINYDKVEHNLNLLEDEEKKKFSEVYNKIKKLDIIHNILSICDVLIPYKKYVMFKETLSYKFLLKMSGIEFCPFSFSSFNLKRLITLLYNDSKPDPTLTKEENSKKKQDSENMMIFTMMIMNKLLLISYSLYEQITAPDVDVDEFVQVIMDNIGNVKKFIPGCDKAFRMIEESVELLKNNFSTYYKDFIQSKKSNTIIMENFILDVSKTAKADPQATVQFRKIIDFYRKQAKNIRNPQFKKLFEKVEENFTKLDRHENIRKDKKGEFDKDETSDESDDNLEQDSNGSEEDCEEIIADEIKSSKGKEEVTNEND